MAPFLSPLLILVIGDVREVLVEGDLDKVAALPRRWVTQQEDILHTVDLPTLEGYRHRLE